MYKNFNFVEVMKQLSHKIMSFAMGRYFLSRNVGDANGVHTYIHIFLWLYLKRSKANGKLWPI